MPEKFVGVETYLFDCNQDLYGKQAEVYLYHFQRPEKRFESWRRLRGSLLWTSSMGGSFLLWLSEDSRRKYFEKWLSYKVF